MREPVDEDRAGEVLEPRPACREGVAEEVGREMAGDDEPDRRARAGRRGPGPGIPCGLGYAPPALCSAA
jgi:hypothetical protein